MLYPDVNRIHEVSLVVAREVIRQSQFQGLDREKSIRHLKDDALDEWIQTRMYDPTEQKSASNLVVGKSVL